MTPWDIYIANVPFEDVPQSKLRPVIILKDFVLTADCLKMTSKPPRAGEYALQKWHEAGLLKPTTVRISKRLLLNHNALLRRIGAVHPIDILEIQKRISI